MAKALIGAKDLNEIANRHQEFAKAQDDYELGKGWDEEDYLIVADRFALHMRIWTPVLVGEIKRLREELKKARRPAK